jgi:octaprenyl-diphosphate synthase
MSQGEAALLKDLLECVSSDLARVTRRFDVELESDLPPVNQLIRHVARFRGKMLRPTLVLLCGKACGGVTDEHITIATVVEMVHMSTLVHDDVLDEAELRRKGATLNHLRGNEAAVLLGDFLISHSFHLCSSLDSQYASRLIGATTNRLCEGELLQIDNRNNFDLTEETYFQIITRKTASLIAASCHLGARFAGASESVCAKLENYGLCLGRAFQIQDDILDLVGDESTVGKSLGIDVYKTKLTLPIIHFLRSAPHKHRLLMRSLLASPDPDRLEKIRNLILPTPSIGYAQMTARDLVSQAVASLDTLEDSQPKQALVRMAEFVVSRGA